VRLEKREEGKGGKKKRRKKEGKNSLPLTFMLNSGFLCPPEEPVVTLNEKRGRKVKGRGGGKR